MTRSDEGVNDPGNKRVNLARYDVVGNRVWTWDSTDVQTTYAYDALGRQTEVVRGANLAQPLRTTLSYNVFGEVTASWGPLGTTSYDYDRLGRQRKITQANGHETYFDYDIAGNRTLIADRQKGYRYTSQGATTTVPYDVRSTTVYEYDALSRQIGVTDPNNKLTTYTLDRLGRVVSVVDRNTQGSGFPARASGRHRGLEYDRLGRLTRETWYDVVNGSETVVSSRNYEYDSANNLVASYLTDNGAGARATTLRHDRDFDDFNRLKTDQGAFGGTLTYYYYAGHRKWVTNDAWNVSVGSTYDAAGRLTERRWSGGSIESASVQLHYQPDPNAAVTARLDRLGTMTYHAAPFPNLANPSLTTTYGYDGLGRVSRIEHRRSTELPGVHDPAELLETTYNASGLVERERRGNQLTGDYHPDVTYTYDAVGQVATSRTNGGATQTFEYDDGGNVVSHLQPQPGNRVHIAGGWRLAYDAEGNVTWATRYDSNDNNRVDQWRYEYDHANRLVAVEKGTYVIGTGASSWQREKRYEYRYDAEGRLVEMSDATGAAPQVLERYAHDGIHVRADLDAAGYVKARYLRGDGADQLFARQYFAPGSPGLSRLAWYLADRQGSVLQVIAGSNGMLLKAVAYAGAKAVGRMASSPAIDQLGGPLPDRYEYTGRPYYQEVWLQHNRARWYDPSTSRWLSEDPIGFASGDTNLYRYVGNSHPNATDPSGHITHPLDWIGETFSESISGWDSALGHSRDGWFTRVSTGAVGWADTFTFGVTESVRGLARYDDVVNKTLLEYNVGVVAGGLTHALYGNGWGVTFAGGKLLQNYGTWSLENRGADWALPEHWARGARVLGGGVQLVAGLRGLSGLGRLDPTQAGRLGGVVSTAQGGMRLMGNPWVVGGLLTKGFYDYATAKQPMGWDDHALFWMGTTAQVGPLAGRGLNRLAPDRAKAISTRAHSEGGLVRQLAHTAADWLGLKVCFAAGTPLLTPEGSKPIERFRVGDLVLARDEGNPQGLRIAEPLVLQRYEIAVGFLLRRRLRLRGRRGVGGNPTPRRCRDSRAARFRRWWYWIVWACHSSTASGRRPSNQSRHSQFNARHRPGRGDRAGDRAVPPAAPSPGVPGVPGAPRRDAGAAGGHRHSPRDGQLRHAPAPQGEGVVRPAPGVPAALHAHQRVVAQPGGALLRADNRAAHPARLVQEPGGTGAGDRGLPEYP